MFHVKPFLLFILLFPFISIAQHVGQTRLEIRDLPAPPPRVYKIDEFLKPYSSGLNSFQQEWFYWTNYSRENPRRFWDSVVAPILNVYPAFRNNYTKSLKDDLYKVATLPFVKPNADLAKVAQSLANALLKGAS